MKLIGLMMFVLCLSACAGTSDRRGARDDLAMRQALHQDAGFCEGLMADPALDPLRRKTTVDHGALRGLSADQSTGRTPPVSFEMIADRSEVTDIERAVLGYWTEREGICRDRLQASELRLGRPALAAHRVVTAQAEAALRQPLISGEWNWGQYNVARRSLLAEVRRVDAEIRLALQTGDAATALRIQQRAAADLDGNLWRQRLVLSELTPVLQRGMDAPRH